MGYNVQKKATDYRNVANDFRSVNDAESPRSEYCHDSDIGLKLEMRYTLRYRAYRLVSISASVSAARGRAAPCEVITTDLRISG